MWPDSLQYNVRLFVLVIAQAHKDDVPLHPTTIDEDTQLIGQHVCHESDAN